AELPGTDLDLDFLADFLLIPGSMSELPTDRCIYRGISRLRPGYRLTANLADLCVEQRPYWDWQAHIKDPGTDQLDVIAEQYGQLLRQAVQTRLQGTALAHLSGGMDSTAVALMARDALAAKGEPPLATLSLVYKQLPGLGRETPYVEAASR